MKKHTFRALLTALGLICVSATAQVPSAANRIPSAANRINPASNRIVVPQSQPTIITPVTPGYIPPVTPVYPGGLPPGTIITTQPYFVPTYPSGWVGPTIIRETHSEPAPSANTTSSAPLP